MRLRTTQFLIADCLAGNLLDDLRPGDEHPRRLRLNHEVGQCGTVDSAPGAGSADD